MLSETHGTVEDDLTQGLMKNSKVYLKHCTKNFVNFTVVVHYLVNKIGSLCPYTHHTTLQDLPCRIEFQSNLYTGNGY